MRDRDYRIDNLRAALIALVVFCHLLVEVGTGSLGSALYQPIYVFHMPAFVFVTGYFARFRPAHMLRGLAVPYVVFQILSCVRKSLVAGRAWWQGLTLLKPQWTLWYLLACVLWYATLPALEKPRSTRARALVVGASMVLSLTAGFVPWLTDVLDLSRVVTLYPFFCAGVYAGRSGLSGRVARLPASDLRRVRVILGVVVAAFVVVHAWHGPFPKEVLYRDTPYSGLDDLLGRCFVQLAAVAWCGLVFVCAPRQDLGFVSEVGRNTLCVYLLHPWLLRVMRLVLPFPGTDVVHVLACAVLDAGILALLGNDRVGQSFRRVFVGGRRRGGRA